MPDQSQVLQVTLFGCPRIVQPQMTEPVALGRKTNELLALLLLHKYQSHHREKLAATLWSESSPESASHSFRTTLWRLRQALEPPGVARGTYLSVSVSRELGFNWGSEYSVDVLDFQSTLKRYDNTDVKIDSSAEIQSVEAALRLYDGELLEGHFDDWIIYERERLRDQFICGVSALMRAFMRRQDYQQAITCGRRVLAEDPLRESVHRDLMESYANVGQRAEAIKLYEQLRQTLDLELAVAPADQTTKIFLSILRPNRASDSRSAAATSAEFSKAVTTLQSSLNTMQHEQGKMCRTLESLKSVLASRQRH